MTPGGASPVFKAYGHALSMNPELLDYRWCGIIDSDELIGFEQGSFGSLKRYISWQESQPVDAIALNWLIFGSGGVLRWHDEPMLSRFQRRYGESSIKTIFRPQMFHHAIGHFPITSRPSEVVCRDATGQLMPAQTPDAPTPRDSPAWIAHYFYRSFEEFVWKFSRGRGDQPLQTGLPMVNVPEEFMEGFVAQYTNPGFTRDDRMLAFAPGMKAEAERLRALPGVQEALDGIHAYYRRRSAALEPALRQLRQGASPTRAAFYDLLLEPDLATSSGAVNQKRREAMAINNHDGRYAIDCWIDAEASSPAGALFSDELDELVLEANRLIASRECRRVDLCEKRASEPDGWFRITRLSVPE